MIRCSACGTINESGRHTCAHCGAPLPGTEIKCPHCGALNPVGNTFCDQCNARLIPEPEVLNLEAGPTAEDQPAIRGLSLPTRSTKTSSTPDEEEALPDWLRELSAETEGIFEEEEAGPLSEEPVIEPDSLPEWLRGEALEGTPDLEEASQRGENAPEELEPTPEETLPDWLRSTFEETSAPTEESTLEEAESPPEEALPDWLRGTFEQTEEVSSEETVSPFSEEALPDWLQEIEAESSAPAEPAPQPDLDAGQTYEATPLVTSDEETSPKPSGPVVFSESEVPEWLAEFDLAGETQPEAPQPPESAALEPVTASDEESTLPEPEPLTEEDLPEWLRALAGTEEAAAPSEPPSTTPVEETVPSADEPSAAPEAPAPVFTLEELTDAEIELPTETSEELPEWLQELGSLEAQQETTTTGTAPPTGELPPWLEAMMPPDVATEYAQTGGEVFVTKEGEALFQAEVPPWLEDLRTGEAAAQPEPQAPLSPPEPEGPLEGLRGTLPGLTLVDAPSEPPLSMSRLEIPETVIAQAQLWQRLLERPRSSRQTVAHTLTPKPRVERGLKLAVALILILSVLVGITGVPEIVSPQPTRSIPPGVAALAQVVSALQPGDTVIIATDFDAAYADEMALMAHALLEQLAQRKIVVIQASTLPEGLGLGAALLREARLEPGADRPYYLPGNANGIAEFLARPDVGEASHLFLLTSQPQRLRWWVEQGQTAAGGKIPMSVLLTASAAPASQPYLQTNTVIGWMVGGTQLPDLYQALTGMGKPVHVPRVEALRVTQWAAAALLILGTFYATLSRRKGTG